ncbi:MULTISPECIES: sensor histidine kinase [unclassified Bartonella]|uniref:sensor histidine kinase n=1 Tax=unclassified Bartonella TaxID=2645622 RepID=UPI000999813B|nr:MULTISPECIES: HAMP domain-containing sensor histidine kinase [unclassified Bartonella]AQX27658.1 Signal transduction histidine kinase [Bartonella sp. JB15]AQX28939.1 Signal transduction histidine kinase [Bartonella sp. JB63]
MRALKNSNRLKRLFFFIGKSLSLRVMILSTLWAIISLSSISAVSILFYQRSSEQSLERILSSQLYSLISAVTVTSEGYLKGKPEFGDIRYSDPTSGWYWEVFSVSPDLHGRLASQSLGTKKIFSPSDAEVPFNSEFFRSYRIKGVDGQNLKVIESDVVLDNQNRIARFRLIGNIDEVYVQVKEFEQTLQIFLWSLGIGSVFINLTIIFFSFQPLKRIRQTLNDIRAGRTDYVSTDLLSEVMPLAQEMNALIDNNQRIIERFRTQVGNLAHSLKTPLSVIINEVDNMTGEQAILLREQAGIMRSQINHYLRRARIAAQRDSVVYHTPVRKTLDRLVRVMRKLNPDKDIQFTIDVDDIIFSGEREDLEEIVGNLIENAVQWSRTKILICCSLEKSFEKTGFFNIVIEDDGPGLTEEKIDEALKRGRRFDESKPGTGLGLAIVSDMVSEYDGKLSLSRSKLGGLYTKVVLPS